MPSSRTVAHAPRGVGNNVGLGIIWIGGLDGDSFRQRHALWLKTLQQDIHHSNTNSSGKTLLLTNAAVAVDLELSVVQGRLCHKTL
jgi:hypothetical protein